MADVMGNSIVAEKAKLELPKAWGSVQSSCYASPIASLESW
jgi:hypothetical protein